MNRFLIVAAIALRHAPAFAQPSFWTDLPAARAAAIEGERRIAPRAFRALALDVPALRAYLQQVPAGELNQVASASSIIALPMPEGGFTSFRILEVPVMHPELQARFPQIRTYTGVGLEDGALLKMDLTPHGFHAMVLVPGGEDWFIDPLVHGDAAHCQSYLRRDFVKQLPPDHRFCRYGEVNDLEAAEQQTLQWMAQMGADRVGDCQLRRYRLALACTGEYANYHGSNTANNDKSFAAAAMATSLNRVNGMFERDATLTMQLVANNDQLIYLNGATDPYTNNNGGTMLTENVNTCNAVIGSGNYDIGHVFSTGGGGVAYLNSPCMSYKAGGVTGLPAPEGDPFDIDYVAHEMGHQFGANHTQNNNCQRASAAAVEVGSGITIMGYAGICAPNVASNSIAMFGAFSMQEIAANVTAGNSSTCPTLISTGNQQPTATAGPGYTIPRSTPFILGGSGSDPDPGDVLTYSWEQMNNTVATQPPQPTNTGGPAFRPFLPVNTPVRYMPNLPAVVANTTPTWEVLSSVARSYAFRLTVRDNRVGGGCAKQSNMTVTVNGASGPFAVTAPNTAVSWPAYSAQSVTWNVAGT
ncbi:MAG: reprolysin-like metallopeptidase, partial [Flavobacteriales bacterium]